MPRIRMCRRVCGEPGARYFKPHGIPLKHLAIIDLRIDEFEALRLADANGMHQVDAAAQMGVSRQTFGLMVRAARSKIARALSEGAAVRISGDQDGCLNEAEGDTQ